VNNNELMKEKQEDESKLCIGCGGGGQASLTRGWLQRPCRVAGSNGWHVVCMAYCERLFVIVINCYSLSKVPAICQQSST